MFLLEFCFTDSFGYCAELRDSLALTSASGLADLITRKADVVSALVVYVSFLSFFSEGLV